MDPLTYAARHIQYLKVWGMRTSVRDPTGFSCMPCMCGTGGPVGVEHTHDMSDATVGRPQGYLDLDVRLSEIEIRRASPSCPKSQTNPSGGISFKTRSSHVRTAVGTRAETCRAEAGAGTAVFSRMHTLVHAYLRVSSMHALVHTTARVSSLCGDRCDTG